MYPMRRKTMLLTLVVLGLSPLGAMILRPPAGFAETAVVVQPPAVDEPVPAAATSETAVLAGGCFWGVQGVFQHVDGVSKVVSGLCRRQQGHGAVQPGRGWRYRPRRNGPDHL